MYGLQLAAPGSRDGVFSIVPDSQIRKYAKFLATRTPGIDAKASTADDYAQDLRLRMWKLWTERPNEQPGYYHRALYYQTAKLRRSRVRALKNTPFALKPKDIKEGEREHGFSAALLVSPELHPDPADLDNALAARSGLRVLDRVLSLADRILLRRAADGQPMTKATKVKLEAARARARLALEGNVQQQQKASSTFIVDKNALPLWELSDEEVIKSGRLPCFGQSLEVKSDSCAQECHMRERCVVRIASHTMVDVLVENGRHQPHTPLLALPQESELSELLGCDTPTAQAVLKIARVHPSKRAAAAPSVFPTPVVLPKQQDNPLAPLPLEAPPAPPVSESALDALLPPPPVPDPVFATDPLVKEPDPLPSPPPPVESPPVKTAAPPAKKKASSKPAPKKKAAPKPKAAKKAPAPPKAPPSPVIRVAPPPAREGEASMDELVAFQRERQKSKFVAGLQHGQVLKREWKGVVHELVVDLKGYRYVLDGKHSFTTVYESMAHLCGLHSYAGQRSDGGRKTERTMTAWSSAKFWGFRASRSKEALAAREKSSKKARKKK